MDPRLAVHPGNGRDLVVVASSDGHGLFDAVAGENRPGTVTPTSTPTLLAVRPTSPVPGRIAGRQMHIAGRVGGGLHTTPPDSWPSTSSAPSGHTIASGLSAGDI
jgi:hypothetical protein